MRVFVRVLLFQLGFVFCFASLCTPLPSAEPQFTAEQRKQLEEANRLNFEALKLFQQGRAKDAVIPARQALAIRKSLLGEKHFETANSLNALSVLLHSLGDSATARAYCEQALVIYREVLDEKHPNTVQALNNLGMLLRELGDFAAARPYLEKVLAIRIAVRGEKHPDTAESLNNFGDLLRAMGSYSVARPYLEQALAIRKAVLGEKHPATATSLDSLGSLLVEMGDYAAARPYLEQALAVRKAVQGEKHPATATSLNSLGLLLMSMRDYAEARPYLEQALAIHNEVLGAKHPMTAHSLNSLGGLHHEMRNYAAARPCYEQALAISREVQGEIHPATARLYSNLGVLLKAMGDYAAARPNLEKALEIRKKVLGEKHPDVAVSLNGLGVLLKAMRDYAAARSCYEQALAIRRDVLDKRHPDTATSLVNLAVLEEVTGNWKRSIELMDEARRVARAHLVRTLPGMGGAEQLRFLQRGDAWTFRAAVALGVERRADPNVAATSAGWLVNGKATTQESLAQQAILASDAREPARAESVKQLLAARRELANLVMTTPKPGQEEARQRRLVQLESEEESLAREVGRATGRPADAKVWIELDEVRQTIPADGVLVDLARYQPFNFQAERAELLWRPARYAAWLIPAVGHGDIEIVDLGPAEEIETVVAEFRAAIQKSNAQPQTDVDGVLEHLAKLVYEPLAGRLASTRHWLVSPDGELWTVPWGALRLNEKTYAIERHDISYLVSSRDLLNRRARGTSSDPVVMADPDYELSPADAKAIVQEILTNEQVVTRGDSTRSRDLVPQRWRRLPGTAAEAAAIEPQLQAFAKAKPRLFLGERALETVVKNVHGPRVLVLSTHGFFLADQSAEDVSSVVVDDEPRGKLSENPLLRCGIVLAGANQLTNARQGSDADDGLLTGLEIVACDLRGTELTVLSGCQTGLGDIHDGQGVAGLRQAFQLAGAECVMASLWEVPDQETAELMKAFFQNLAAGQTKAVALGNAQRARIEWRRKESGDSHPWYWAAFTVTGR